MELHKEKDMKLPLRQASPAYQRDSNFEALRIVCILLIVAGHLIMWHEYDSLTVERILRCGVRPFLSVAVNCFILISGWFGINFKLGKIVSLNSAMTVWTLVLCGVALLIGIHEIDIRKDVLMLVPLLTRKYWFITVYVALCFLAPYLNIMADALSKKEFKNLLVICICMFVLLPTLAAFFNFESLTLDSGYGIVNFTVLYLFGRYMKIHEVPHRPAIVYLGIYIGMMTACGIIQMAYSRALGFEFTSLISYDTFFVFFGATALFCMFSKLNFQNKYVNILASASFAVYILHIHPWIGGWFFEDFMGMDRLTDGWFISALLIVPVITYLACFALERLRKSLFRGIKLLLSSKLSSKDM